MSHVRPFSVLLLAGFILGLVNCKNARQPEEALSCKRTGNEVIVRLVGEPDKLNPLLTTTNYAGQINGQLFLLLEDINPATMKLEPQLARNKPEIREITSGPYAGGMAYTFEIHDEAVWDDGSAVTGHDYAFSVKAVLNPKVPAARLRPYLSIIREVEVAPDNPRRFTVYTDGRYITGEERVSGVIQVMPAYIYDPQGLLRDIPIADFADEQKLLAAEDKLQQFADQLNDARFSREPGTVSGCGPYKLDLWETGQRVILSKKTGWWGDKLADRYPLLEAFPDQIIYKPITDAATSVVALRAEEVDVMPDLAPKDFAELKGDSSVIGCFDLESPIQLASAFISLNTRNAKLSDKRVRRALAHAVNVPELINTLFFGLAEPLAGPVHPNAPYVNRDLNPIDYNPEKARQLLAEAGWQDTNNNGVVDKEIDGERVEMELQYLYTAGREISQQTALLLQQSAAPAGIRINPEAMEFNQIVQAQRRGDFETAGLGRSLVPTLWEPKQNYHSSGDNRTGFGNAETDALIDRIMTTFDEEERDRLYKQLQAIIYDEQPEVFILAPKARIALHRRFEYTLSPLHPGFSASALKLKELQ